MKSLVPKRITSRNKSDITAVAVSNCGHYAVVGCADGSLHRYALQSQGHRGVFRAPLKKSTMFANCISTQQNKNTEHDESVLHKAPISSVAV